MNNDADIDLQLEEINIHSDILTNFLDEELN